MGCSGDLRTFLEQILEDGRGLVRTAVVHENGRPEKLCLGPDVRALEEGLERAQGGFALGLGVLVAGPVQKSLVLQALGFGQLEPVAIPPGE